MNLIPFLRLYFLTVGLSPLASLSYQQYRSLTVNEIAEQMCNASNLLCTCNQRVGKFLSAAAIFKGVISQRDVDEQMVYIKNRNSENFVE